MRTTLDIPEDKLKKVMEITSSKTKIEAIIKALKNLVEMKKRENLINFKGKIDLDIDLVILRKRNLKF